MSEKGEVAVEKWVTSGAFLEFFFSEFWCKRRREEWWILIGGCRGWCKIFDIVRREYNIYVWLDLGLIFRWENGGKKIEVSKEEALLEFFFFSLSSVERCESAKLMVDKNVFNARREGENV